MSIRTSSPRFIPLIFLIPLLVMNLASCAKKKEETLIKGGKSLVRWSGTKLFGSSSSGAVTNGRSVGVDSSGNVYLAGSSTGELDGQVLAGTTDSFVTKYNSLGVRQWTRMLGDAGATTEARGVAIDSTNNVYLTGFTNGDLDDQTLTGVTDIFIAKYSSSGAKQWTRQLGIATQSAQGHSIAVDGADNIYVTGYTDGNLDGLSLSGSNDIFIIKYSSSGMKLWTRLLGPAAASSAYAYAITTDSANNVYVSGYVNANLDGKAKTGSIDLFITKFNSAGTKQWTELLGVAGAFTIGRGITADSSGYIYVCGETNGNLDNEGNSSGAWYSLVSKYDSNGTKQWTRLLGANATETYCRSASSDSSGDVVLAGITTASLGGNSKTGNTDFFLTRYDATGVRTWTKQMGVLSSVSEGYSIKLNSSGDAFVTGTTNGALDGKSLSGTYDSFILKFNPSGIKQ